MDSLRSSRKTAIAPLLALALVLLTGIAAAMEPLAFRSEAEEARFRALAAELRCVMCQNQSLADSSAPIAHDLRLEVLRLMHEGRSDAEIKDYLVERYSDFVLYKPPLQAGTWLLWFGPALLVLAGALVVAAIVRRRARNAPSAEAPAGDEQEW
ncbi:cytochrome c-type biogenesis protein [Coralloluteibacterium stylophorae]|uniref:Cytochrome c-type biogenesis protein n=2 Tax=Coralloluteibacterium stylophorae TaxID=1776034 RepID=A0AAP2CB48_9GAMM|nr:cytochrome c-type biogenesis protein [Coralloluteibacterium stylophorae]MBS7457558.1 cytochrome c-type biogenesis protein CcmH [Coralloluteibacterium stylophorae]